MTIFVTPELYDDDARRYRAKPSDLLPYTEECLICEALHCLLKRKQEALATINTSLRPQMHGTRLPFSEYDFGIPHIRDILKKLGEE